MVHLEDTAIAGAAVVGAVWFDRVAFLAIAWFARRLGRERGWGCGLMGRERCVAAGGWRVRRRSRVFEDSDCIARDGERVEDETNQRRCLAWNVVVSRLESRGRGFGACLSISLGLARSRCLFGPKQPMTTGHRQRAEGSRPALRSNSVRPAAPSSCASGRNLETVET